MAREAKQGFNWRGFVLITTGLSFLAMSITGIVLFITPKGRVAHWVEWRMLGLTKDQWGGLHIWFSLIFLVMAVFHIYLNWHRTRPRSRRRNARRQALVGNPATYCIMSRGLYSRSFLHPHL